MTIDHVTFLLPFLRCDVVVLGCVVLICFVELSFIFVIYILLLKRSGCVVAVDGRWGAWRDWDQCSVTCGTGVSTRTRQCNWPPAQRGGAPCPGDHTQTKPCAMDPCPGRPACVSTLHTFLLPSPVAVPLS